VHLEYVLLKINVSLHVHFWIIQHGLNDFLLLVVLQILIPSMVFYIHRIDKVLNRINTYDDLVPLVAVDFDVDEEC